MSRLAAFVVAFACCDGALGIEVELTPTSQGDGSYGAVMVAGESAWQNTGASRYLYCKRPDSFSFSPGQTLYVRVTYFDDQVGSIGLQYDAQAGNYTTSSLHTRTSRVGSGKFVNGFFELPEVLFNKRQNYQSDFRINCAIGTSVRVPVQKITLSDTPFADPDFQLAVSRAWQSRYTGPAKDYVDPSTLKYKVMTGYQGWFGTPNDIADTGVWKHWVRNNTMSSENFTIDMWPDLTEYDPSVLVRAGDLLTASGEPAYLFSSRDYSVVKQHFRWMRKHNIDGAWLQRFHPKAGGDSEWVLRHVSQAAAEEGLIWGVEYDVSGMADATVAAKLQADWEWLTSEFDILNDPRYVHEDGKPVVFIWGLSVPSRNFTPASANAVVDYFQGQGVHVIGGLHSSWQSLSAAWQTHMAKYDGVLVWQNNDTSDAAFFRNRGQDFYPHVWPGFSWAHLMKLPATPLTQYTDREGGQFYWNKGRDWINAGGGADRLFIGMFDEYDEATAVMPMTDDPPLPHTAWGRFVTNEGKPKDWWMMLTDELKRMMQGQRPNTATLPSVASLANRSNIGAEASVDLGATNLVSSLSQVELGDGDTIVETVGGRECRGNEVPGSDRYMYFKVDDAFAYRLENGDVTIEVEYYDSAANTVLGLQYDSSSTIPSNPAYTTHPQPITTTGSNTWRRVRFEIADAWFGGRQNGSSDFRLSFGNKKLNVNRLWVRLPEGKAHPFTWTNATAGSDLDWSRNANWLGGVVGQSDLTSIVNFFPGQTTSGGTIPILNNRSGQQFNTIQLGGNASPSADTTVTLSGNAFSLGGAAPSIVLDARKGAFELGYDIAAPVTLLRTIQVAGDGDANFRISGGIDGVGGLIKTGTGHLTLTGSNSFTGGVELRNGTIESRTTSTTLGGGAVTMGGSGSNGATYLSGQPISNPFTINAPDSGAIAIGSNGAQNGFTLSGPIILNGDLTLQSFPNTGAGGVSSANITGGISGTGNLLLNNFGTRANFINLTSNAINHSGRIAVQGQGAGNVRINADIGPNVTGIIQNSASSALILGGMNSYPGDLVVNAGIVRISNASNPLNANPGNDASTVTIDPGATLDLTYSGTDQVDRLVIGSSTKAPGVYGKSGSASPVIGIPQITGNGTLTVASGPSFSSWIADTFANGQVPENQRGAGDDFDKDGIPNLIEYAVAGEDPTVSNATVGSLIGATLSFVKRPGTIGLEYAIEESTDLGINDDWTEVAGGSYVNSATTISYTLNLDSYARNFLRLRILAD